MSTSYLVWDEANRPMAIFAGPHRLARWNKLPDGWSIERYQGDTSLGKVSLTEVREHAEREALELEK